MSGSKKFVWLSLVAALAGAPSVSDAAFLPSDVPGLKLWLDAGYGVTVNGSNQVTQWNDRTDALNNNVAENVSADIGDPNPEPAYLATGLGGMPALGFTPAGYTRLENTTQNPLAAGAARTIIVVGQAASTTPGPLLAFRRGPAQQVFVDRYYEYNGGLYVYEDYPLNSAYIPGSGANLAAIQQPFISTLASTGAGGTLSANLNGEDQTVTWQVPGNSITNDNGNAGFTVGAIANDGQTWNGLISEVLVYDRVLTASELNAVGFYLGEKYSVENTFEVPEPASVTLAGLAGLALARRRTRR